MNLTELQDAMLRLDSADWFRLKHAYGEAGDIPNLLRKLAEMPERVPDPTVPVEPWESIWSALAHQGDVYSASFAALPHVISILASEPERASSVFFFFPTWVEICRQNKKMNVPDQLGTAYFGALQMLPQLVCRATSREWNADFLRSALAAIAISKGPASIAEAILELDETTAKQILTTVHG